MKSQGKGGSLGLLTLPIFLVIILLLLPIILLLIVFNSLYKMISKPKSKIDNPKTWIEIKTPENSIIEYKWVKPNEVPENLLKYYEDQGLTLYRTHPEIEFFKGYFSDFKVERDDGLFVQKIIFDNLQQNILAAPLFFYKFSNNESEEIIDLLDYKFDSKGNPNDFIIRAKSLDENFEIRLTK